MSNIVEVKDLSKSFFGAKALNHMNFSIAEGEIHCLIGENGCGKSTMIKIISGFYDYEEGEVFLNGKLLKKISPSLSMQEGVQVIYQDFALFPNLSVAENICMYEFEGGNQKLVNWKEARRKARELLAVIGIEMDVDTIVGELSVAQKQVVAICRALLQKARLIIMDEPTTALTYKEVEALYGIVKGLAERGIAVMFVSHKLDEIFAVSKRITIMRDGKNVFDGNAENLSQEELIYHMTGKQFENKHFIYKQKTEEPILETKKLSLEGRFHDIDFTLQRGEILGITGLLGSGRTELAETLFGLRRATGGSVRIKGKSVHIRSVSDAQKYKIGYVPEDRLTEGIHMDQSIGDNAIVCVTDQLLNHLKLFNNKLVRKRKEEVLHKVTIAGMEYEKPARALSGGNQQKVVLVKWLATTPDILILNCPTVGVDVSAKNDIHEIIRSLAREGMSVIVISDDMPEVLQLCNRLLVMRGGVIVAEIRTEETSLQDLEEFVKMDA